MRKTLASVTVAFGAFVTPIASAGEELREQPQLYTQQQQTPPARGGYASQPQRREIDTVVDQIMMYRERRRPIPTGLSQRFKQLLDVDNALRAIQYGFRSSVPDDEDVYVSRRSSTETRNSDGTITVTTRFETEIRLRPRAFAPAIGVAVVGASAAIAAVIASIPRQEQNVDAAFHNLALQAHVDPDGFRETEKQLRALGGLTVVFLADKIAGICASTSELLRGLCNSSSLTVALDDERQAVEFILNWRKDIASRPTVMMERPPPGDCNDDQHRQLQRRIELQCKYGGVAKCENIESNERNRLLAIARADNVSFDSVVRRTARERFYDFLSCADARRDINNICFRGGDSTHREQENAALNGAEKCRKRFLPVP